MGDTEINIEFRNIYNRENDKASCGFMRIGEIKILFDCGCTEKLRDADENDPESGIRRVAEAAS